MDGGRTTTRQYSEYSDFRSRYRPTPAGVHPSQMGGRDGRREPDSGLGYTQDYRSRWTPEDCVDPDSVTQRTEHLVGRKRRVGGRPPEIRYLKRRLYTETVGGISHGIVPCLRPTDQIVQRPAVTLRRATHTSLRM